MKLKFLLAATALFFTSLASHAGIIYEWKGVKKESPSVFSMSMEFDEATVRSGSFSLRVESGVMQVRPNSGLIAFRLQHSSYRPQTDVFNHCFDFGYFYMDVDFIEGKFLVGSIQFFDFQTQLNMATGFDGARDNRIFTIYDTNADYGMGDCAGPSGVKCWGGTGHIREVPEPASIVLLAIGALTAYAVRRRRTS